MSVRQPDVRPAVAVYELRATAGEREVDAGRAPGACHEGEPRCGDRAERAARRTGPTDVAHVGAALMPLEFTVLGGVFGSKMSGAVGRCERPTAPNHPPAIGGRTAMAKSHSIAQQRLFDAKPYVGPKATPQYQAEWRRKNPERVKAYEDKRREARREYNRQWNKKNPHKRSVLDRRSVLKAYGLTEETYAAMVAKQDGKCAICRRPPNARKTSSGHRYFRLSVDHCHQTEKVRELLCDGCNGLLGYARDNPEVLQAAIDYLRRHA